MGREQLNALLARPAVARLLALLNGTGAETRIVGGAVRNALIGRAVADVDLATTLLPEATIARARDAGLHVVPTGLTHGTVTVIVEGEAFEVTTLRRDVETDGRHAVVAFSDSFEVDALRRDFTINQLSLSASGALHDYAGGRADLEARRVRFIGDARQRIREDYLRILRLFRFHAEYGAGDLDAEGLEAAAELSAGMARLSGERIRAELLKLLIAPGVLAVVPALARRGIWEAMVPGVAIAPERLDAAIAAFPDCDGLARLAALAARTESDVAVLDARLKLSAQERRRLQGATALAGAFTPATTQAQWLLAALRHGDETARDALAAAASAVGPMRARELASATVPANPFRGSDVLALGLSPGPLVGVALDRALLAWAEAGFPHDPAIQRDLLAKAAAEVRT